MDDFDFEISETGTNDSPNDSDKKKKNGKKAGKDSKKDHKKDKDSKKDKNHKSDKGHKNHKDDKKKGHGKKDKEVSGKKHKKEKAKHEKHITGIPALEDAIVDFDENGFDKEALAEEVARRERLRKETFYTEPQSGSRVVDASQGVQSNATADRVANSHIGSRPSASAYVDDDDFEDDFEIIEEDEAHVKSKSEKRKKNMVRLIIGAIVVLTVCSFGCYTFIMKSAELDKFESILIDGQYKKAADIYDNLMDSQQTTADAMIVAKADKIYQTYYKKKIDSAKAIEHLRELDKVSINDIPEIDEMLTLFNKIVASESNFINARDSYRAGKVVQSIKLFRVVIKEDAYYSNAQISLKKATGVYRDARIEEAEKYAEDEDYDTAIKVMEEALEILLDDEEAQKQLQTYRSAKLSLEISDIMDTVNISVMAKKYVSAIGTVNKAMQVYGEDTRLLDMMSSLIDSMYKQVDEYLESERYTSAVAVLKSYARIMPDDEKANQLIARYKHNVAKGHYLASITAVSKEGKYYKIDDIANYSDAQGMKYESVLEVVGYKNLDKKGNFVVENSKYTNLAGTIGYVGSEDLDYYNDGKGRVRIYGDGNEIYKSGVLSEKSENEEISLDITGYKKIKVAWEPVDDATPYGIVLGDFIVR